MRKNICLLLCFITLSLLGCSNVSEPTTETTLEDTTVITEPTDETTLTTLETVQPSLSEYETLVIFRQMYEETGELLQDIIDATLYWNETDFTTIAQIKQLESLWADMAAKSQKMVDVISENTPAPKYEQQWNDYKVIIVEVPPIFETCANLDPNNDGTYITEEMLPLLREAKKEATAKLDESWTITKKVPIPYQAPSSENSKQCTVCQRKATHTYTNPFSNEAEPYCDIHHQEILDMMHQMEADVRGN